MTRTVENLNPREVAFAEYYGLVGSETYSNASASAKKAGYADPTGRTVGWKLLKREPVRAKIQQVHAAQMNRLYLTADKVMSDIEDARLKADKKGDIAASLRASELQAKYLGLLIDRQSIETPEKQAELNERERTELLALAAVRLGAVAMLEGGETGLDDTRLHPQHPRRLDCNYLPSDA